MNLIITMIFMKIPLKFQVLLQQSCLVDGGLYTCQVVRPSLMLQMGFFKMHLQMYSIQKQSQGHASNGSSDSAVCIALGCLSTACIKLKL